MKDVFGTGNNSIVLTAADKDGETMIKKDKKDKTNMVKIYLASIPSLESAKDALTEISESIPEGPTKTKIDEFVASIVKITEDILDLTKVAVKGVRKDEGSVEQLPSPEATITPGMISGRNLFPGAKINVAP